MEIPQITVSQDVHILVRGVISSFKKIMGNFLPIFKEAADGTGATKQQINSVIKGIDVLRQQIRHLMQIQKDYQSDDPRIEVLIHRMLYYIQKVQNEFIDAVARVET